ncbi:MAG: SH3 domain-containing protein [Chitinispirillia bacterium]|nr:SH3 domain-containing protein [Chitinispirillia bacterium]
MGKRMVFLAAVALGCVLAAGCGDKKKGEDGAKSEGKKGAVSSEASSSPASNIPVWEGAYRCKKGDGECRDDKNFGDGIYFAGTIFNTTVTSDVNVRPEPSGNGSPLFQAKNETQIQILGISKTGDWAFVTIRDVVPKRGWVSAQFIKYKEDAKPTSSELKITNFNFTARDSSTAELTAVYKADGTETTMKINAFKEKGQNFFTFFCDAYTSEHHYKVMPGLYAWTFARNQLKHVAPHTRVPFVHGEGSAIWDKALLTDDHKFFQVEENDKKLLFRATATGAKLLLPGLVYDSFNLHAKTITSVCPADALVTKDFPKADHMDAAISEYGDEYVNHHQRPEGDSMPSLQVLCETNLETGARKITGAEWRF